MLSSATVEGAASPSRAMVNSAPPCGRPSLPGRHARGCLGQPAGDELIWREQGDLSVVRF